MLPNEQRGFVKCYQNEQGELPTVTKMVSGVLFTNVIKSLIVFMLLYLELLHHTPHDFTLRVNNNLPRTQC